MFLVMRKNSENLRNVFFEFPSFVCETLDFAQEFCKKEENKYSKLFIFFCDEEFLQQNPRGAWLEGKEISS